MLLSIAFLSAALAAPVDLAPELAAARADSQATLQAPSSDWQVSLARAVVLVERDQPQLASAVRALPPTPTRAGTLRLVGDPLRAPQASAVLAARLTQAAPEAERRAVAEALPRTGGAWHQWAAPLAEVEETASVKAILLEGLVRAPASVLSTVHAALSHDDPTVRAAAARALSGHRDGASYAHALRDALSDPSALVRAEACRGLGWFEDATAWAALEARLQDDSGDVRLRALRALQRIDEARAAQSAAVQAAQDDLDPKVARAAAQIAG